MWINFWNWFTKITAWPVQRIIFRTITYCEDRSVQNRRIKGRGIIVSNHTAVYDYAAFLFVFFSRTIRTQMAEVLFEKKLLGWFLNRLGGIQVNRNTHDMSCMARSEAILKKDGVVLIFPEGRLAKPGEEKPLPFKEGAAFLALSTDTPIIPVYTDGRYFASGHAHVMIGKPMHLTDYIDEEADTAEAVRKATEAIRQRVMELGGLLNERIAEEK